MTAVPRVVILWVHPRSTSTMFECAMLQRPDFQVLHEPMGDAWYFGSERVSKRYSAEVCAKDFAQYSTSTFKKTWEGIIKPADGSKRVFSKDMAQYIFPLPSSSNDSVPSFGPSGNPTLIPTEALLDSDIQHTFLIRTPEKAVPSYHRLCYPGSETGFEYWDPEEAGYRELRLLFDFLRSHGRAPVILESAELLAHAPEVMKSWCESAGIEFNEKMLQWDEGTKEHFKKWPGFHTAAENSQGIGRGVKEKYKTLYNYAVNGKGSSPPDLPEDVRKCIADNMADYNYLLSFVKRI
ncbi:hypothetical protein DFH07DRAFT_413568 [Mycena maculata]|uniref:P-loop containing nucleoside triphosphate hydrolase protein n=1 Tax=Mycena maculata TaxID=230809 RepID=A0AAD7JEE5_9AGAR|nr:hypothetical protein DFH07DRAFT_413568 [Mycena maculata]